MPAWSGVLPYRHGRLLLGRCDLWRPDYPVGAAGPEETTYTQALANVPYLLDRKSAIDNPGLIALMEGEDLITIDTARFPEGTEVGSSWIIVDKTLNATGTEGQNYGGAWVVKGAAVAEDTLDATRPVGMVEAYVSRMNRVPEGVS